MTTRPVPHDDGLPAGVELSRSVLGGYAIRVDGVFKGWIHSSRDGEWNAYQRTGPTTPGRLLGTFAKTEAVRRIVSAT
ncbi:hypothetical protein EV385_1900 [Krasilnikovia cinnamomea]|uniref:Uncharacterized protein n=1 Tax=Krasilnikovia cinnamomea TaxID=349313 RepID=A0A4Q7ZIT6_9ACTN|nr:hypothetical protein [Krasilnikovia cinnamomea]RZU50135.1 hypothetical protein EV385_1900 [Krasilnikovia cinnamomea]